MKKRLQPGDVLLFITLVVVGILTYIRKDKSDYILVISVPLIVSGTVFLAIKLFKP